MTIEELTHLRSTLCAELCFGLPPAAQIAEVLAPLSEDVALWFRTRESPSEAHRVTMLLAALAVAIAWMGSRQRPAPVRRLQEAIARVSDKHLYLLPIPHGGPCFCGSGTRFSECHGIVPLRAPEV
ncbi:MAG: SEC-C metal-binding domain-containing protein [Mycobacterium sp.]